MKNKLLKYACYTSSFTMSIVGNLPPLLFITFRELFGISYSLLGLLILINFSTQLVVDVLFSVFSEKLSVPLLARSIPVLAILGFVIYAIYPLVFPAGAYAGLVMGTLIFSASSGLSEVLISPLVASIPSDNPEAEMSKLHSVYAWGVVFVIAVSTLFLFVFDNSYWWVLVLAFIALPLFAMILFFLSDVPEMKNEGGGEGAVREVIRDGRFMLCIAAIFLGGAAECTMAQWASGYLETALGIPKALGDIFGVAAFALMLGLGRIAYAKRGGDIRRILLLGGVGATACYLIAVVSGNAVVGLVACALTGLCVSMLWPGSLIVVAEIFPAGGVFIYAAMAAGGDLGASLAPQLTGVIADVVSESSLAVGIAERLSLTLDAVGMKAGLLVGAIFSLLSVFVYYRLYKCKK